MLDVSVFSDMRFTAGSVAVTFAFFALFGFVFVVTQYFQFVRGYGTLEAGVRTVPFAVFTASTAPIAAKLAERIGTKVVVTGGLVSMAIGFAIATTTAGRHVVLGHRADDVLPRRRARPRPGAGDGGDHGLAAAGQGRRRLGRQRHRPRARRHARRGHRRQRVLVDLRLPARRRPRRDAGAGRGRGHRRGVGRRGQRRSPSRPAPTAGPQAQELVSGAVDDAFIDGWHAGSWVSFGVVLVGALVAWRFLPARATTPSLDDVERVERELVAAPTDRRPRPRRPR